MLQKRSFLNRCVVAGANGPIILSVPLEKGRMQHTVIKDLRISNEEKWQQQHWKSLLSCYNGSPWFLHYRDELADLYRKPFVFLLDWNLQCLDWSLKKLGIEVNIKSTSEYKNQYPDEGCLDKRNSTQSKSGLQMEKPIIQYRQVFEEKTGFIPGLSILDLLFCAGARSARMLLQA